MKNLRFMVNSKFLIGIGIVVGMWIIYFILIKKPDAPSTTLPTHYYVQENLRSKIPFLPLSFEIYDDTYSYGKISKEVFSLSTALDYEDSKGNGVAQGEKEMFSWGTKIDFFTSEKEFIGAIQEKVFESLLTFYTSYEVLDKNKNIIATSEKFDGIIGTSITLSDAQGNKIVQIDKKFWHPITDTWEITVLKNDVIDPRIIPIIPTFKTHSDNKKKDNSDDDDNDDK